MSAADHPRSVGVGRVNCIGIVVRDLKRSLRFYEALTGIVATPRRRMTHVPGSGGAESHLATIHLPDVNVNLIEIQGDREGGACGISGQIGSMHVCFEVEDVDAVLARLVASEFGLSAATGPFLVHSDHDGEDSMSVAYFQDPDGTQLGLIHPTGTFRRFNETFVR